MTMFVVTSAFAAFLLVITYVDAQVYGRLMNGTAPWNGRLEMFYKSRWRNVCASQFRKQEAQVACRMMGFNTSQVFAVDTKSFEFKEIYLFLDSLRCTGEETSLENCYHLRFSSDSYCSEVVAITCNTEHTRLRFKDIKDMTHNRGLLQVDIGDGHWETLCVSSNITASVVCRHLGLQSQAAIVRQLPDERYYEMVGRITNLIFCLGNEASIFECQLEMSRDVCQDYILCTNSPVNIITNSSRCPLMEETNGTLQCVGNYSVGAQSHFRLMNGTAPWNGRLEMFYKRRWRKVCARKFGKQETQVVCRMLGFNTSQVFAVDTKSFEFKEIYLFLDGLSCTGEETSLENCSHSWFSVNSYCSEVVAITCNTAPVIILTRSSRYPLMEETNSTFKCASNERSDVIKYTWPQNAGGFPDGSSLIITRVTREHHGRRVRCEAIYSDGEVVSSDTLQLQVYYRPVIRITRSDNQGQPLSTYTEVIKGRNVTFVCDADSNPPPASITWSGKVNISTGELHIIAAQQTIYDGNYTCTVVTGTNGDDERLPLMTFSEITLIVKGIITHTHKNNSNNNKTHGSS